MIRMLMACLLMARSIAAFLPPPSAPHLPTHGLRGQLSQPIRGPSSSPLRSARYPCMHAVVYGFWSLHEHAKAVLGKS